MTMETSKSQDGWVGDTVAGSAYINVASQTQISSMAQVTKMEASDDSESSVVDHSQKQRELLVRRPSYKRILNELSSEVSTVSKIDEENIEEDETESTISTIACSGPIYQMSTGQYIAISQGGAIQFASPGLDGVQGLQTLSVANSGNAQQGATILQYAASAADGTQQFFVPGSRVVVQAASGEMPSYQIRTPSSAMPQGVVVAASPVNLHSPQQMAEEATRKREVRLMKNREAAKACRRRKKEYVKCLEVRVAMLEHQKKQLIEELDTVRDCYPNSTD